MVDAKRGVKIVTGVFVAAVMAAFLIPIAVSGLASDDVTTVNQNVSETTDLKPSLNATVDSVTSGTSATYTIEYEGNTATETVNVGANTTVTVGDIDVTISPSEAGTDYAVTEYEYPATAGWGSGTVAIWVILPLLIVLGIFLYMVRMATRYA